MKLIIKAYDNMKNWFKILVMLTILLSENLYSQEKLVDISILKQDQVCGVQNQTSIEGFVIKQQGYYDVFICNQTTDTIYLFSSYINDKYIHTKYIHRIDRKNKKYLISFLPLVPYLGGMQSDVVILGENKLIRRNQLDYNFIEIPPNNVLCMRINQSTLFPGEYVYDVKLKNTNKFDNLKFKKANKNRLEKSENYFQFALYKDISLLRSEEAFYFSECEYNEQANDYQIMELPW